MLFCMLQGDVQWPIINRKPKPQVELCDVMSQVTPSPDAVEQNNQYSIYGELEMLLVALVLD